MGHEFLLNEEIPEFSPITGFKYNRSTFNIAKHIDALNERGNRSEFYCIMKRMT